MPSPQNGIKVFLRVRPTSRPSGFVQVDEDDPERVDFDVPVDLAAQHVNNTKSSYKFRFDGVIQEDAKQDEVFDRVAKDATLSALEGFNATVFAYGQTGSGKTFSITGGAERYVDRGIIPRALSLVFAEVEKRSDMQVTAHISYLEIYNDSGFDLLDPSHESKGLEDLPKVMMMEDEDGNVHLRNLSMHVASSEEDALNLLFLGDTNRAISETPMNLASSRSHCIFTISLEIRQAGSDLIRRSKLHLVDLAGSERVHKTNAGGQLLREAKHINTSLHYLEMVIVALHDRKARGRQHIPYRNSMMTNVLRDSLGGNCKTSMIATISAEASNTEESISTCRFAQRVALVQNDALVNEELDPSMLIKRLKAEVAALREEVAFLKGERDPDEAGGERIDQLERKRLRSVIDSWVRSGSGSGSGSRLAEESKDGEAAEEDDLVDMLQPGPLTFERIHACFGILRGLAASGGGGGGGGADEDELVKLRQQIQQRDNEIAILVNMVKQSKGKGGAELAGLARPAGLAVPVPATAAAAVPAAGADGAVGDGAAVAGLSAPVPPSDVLMDKDRALEFFKRHYAQTRHVNENKRELKSKYALAKQTGESVNASRTEITRIKTEIEQMRAQTALQHMDDEGDGESDGGDRGDGGEAKEEQGRFREMDFHKSAYKQNFQALKDLKREIEHIQAMLGKSRLRLQRDFDTWYALVLKQGLAEDEPHDDRRREEKAHAKQAKLKLKPQQHPAILPAGVGGGSSAAPAAAAAVAVAAAAPVPLTGNQEADADILAFYKAKEALMRRTAAQQHK